MKERPIIFSAPMVQAILEGRKTQTRRIVKFPNGLTTHDDWLEAHEIAPAEYVFWSGPKHVNPDFTRSVYKPGDGILCPFGQPGDRLWVRETFGRMQDVDGGGYIYRASLVSEGEEEFIKQPWKPSIHMPRAASRILLEITDVRVERVRDISEEDAIAEGVERKSPIYWQSYLGPDRNTLSACDSFWTLWSSIYGPESWGGNPWVWVITFKRIEP